MAQSLRPSKDLAHRLRDIARGRQTLDVAQFQFIGLAEIERAYGERWPAHKARIHDIARGFLQKRISNDDVMIDGSDGFLLVLGAMSGHEAEAAALALKHELNAFFLGQLAEGSPSIAVQMRRMPAQDLVQAYDDLDVVAPASRDNSVEPGIAGEIDWRYEPVWDVRREVLSCFYIAPYVPGNTRRVPGYLFEPLSGRPDFVATDEAGLRMSEAGIQRLFRSGQKALVGASVHISSLTNTSSRARIVTALEGFNRNLLRYRLLKITGVAPGFPRIYLAEIVAALKLRVPNIVIGAAWDEPDFASLAQLGAGTVGVALPHSLTQHPATVPLDQLVMRIRAAASCAHAARKPFFVEGAIDARLAQQLGAAGVDYICSPTVWKPELMPAAASTWRAERLSIRAA